MNCVIGLCTKNIDWPSTLEELGYKVELIEQGIRTGNGELVKPDIVAVSNKLIHSLVFECKGGKTVDKGQVSRYDGLRPADLNRWLTVFAPAQLSHDLCFADLEENFPYVKPMIGERPLLTFGNDAIKKSGRFSNSSVEKAFQSPTKMAGMRPPLNYYPFSDQDHDAVIAPRVLRTIVQIALNTRRGGPSSLVDTTFDLDDVLKSSHQYWKALSNEHREELRNRIKTLMKRVLDTNPKLAKNLEELESRRGYRISTLLSNLQDTMEDIIRTIETQQTLNHVL